MPALSSLYQDLIKSGQLRPDPHQAAGLKALTKLEKALRAKRGLLGFLHPHPRLAFIYMAHRGAAKAY